MLDKRKLRRLQGGQSLVGRTAGNIQNVKETSESRGREVFQDTPVSWNIVQIEESLAEELKEAAEMCGVRHRCFDYGGVTNNNDGSV